MAANLVESKAFSILSYRPGASITSVPGLRGTFMRAKRWMIRTQRRCCVAAPAGSLGFSAFESRSDHELAFLIDLERRPGPGWSDRCRRQTKAQRQGKASG